MAAKAVLYVLAREEDLKNFFRFLKIFMEIVCFFILGDYRNGILNAKCDC